MKYNFFVRKTEKKNKTVTCAKFEAKIMKYLDINLEIRNLEVFNLSTPAYSVKLKYQLPLYIIQEDDFVTYAPTFITHILWYSVSNVSWCACCAFNSVHCVYSAVQGYIFLNGKNMATSNEIVSDLFGFKLIL